VIDVEPLDRLAGLEIKTMPSRVVSLELLSADVMKIVLKTPPASPMRFVPGQYVDVLTDGVRRSYSIANAPRADGLLEFFIKRFPGGRLSAYWFERARPNDLVRIEGPFGTFFMRDDQPRDIVFLATGTGIAPVKALLEDLATDPVRNARHRLRLFWGNREVSQFCWHPRQDSGLEVDCHQLLSGPDAAWHGQRGYVQNAAIGDGIDPEKTMIYACGSVSMIASARAVMLAHGLPSRRFLSDAFVSSN
jgi:CDP-4-dehydro-6-deoxyglucose reductase